MFAGKHPFCNKNRKFKIAMCRLTHYLCTKTYMSFYGTISSNIFAYKTCKNRKIFTINGKKNCKVRGLRCFNIIDIEDEDVNEFDLITAKELDAFFVTTSGGNGTFFIRAKVENFNFANANAIFAELNNVLEKENI